MIAFITLILGFILVIKASDILVDCASSIATKLRVPKMLIALTVVSFGTCAPEVAISFQSISAGNGDIALANVIGSCIVNVFFIVGLAVLFKPIKIRNTTIKKELPILVMVTTAFCFLSLDTIWGKENNIFSRVDGYMLILLFGIFIFYLIQMVRNRKEIEEQNNSKYKPFVAIILLILSLIIIVLGSDLIVKSAEKLALLLHLSQKVITMVLIVIGTSLPEMVMTITSAHKGEFDMAIGNIIGTNIFNLCIVLGLPVLIFGSVPLLNFSIIDILAVFLSSLLLYIFCKSEKVISKKEGLAMIFIFIVYYGYILFF